MRKTYLEKIFYASLEASAGNKRRAKDLVVARAMDDETLLHALAMTQIQEIVDLNFSEYVQSALKPANMPKLNDKDLEKLITQIDANNPIENIKKHKQPSWKNASSNVVVIKSGQKALSKKALDHILDHYF